MRAKPECIPCCLRQIIATASRITPDEAVHEELVRRGMRLLLESSLSKTPAEISTALFRLTAEALKADDPYGPEKERYNREAIALYPRLRRQIAESRDPLRTAVLLAVAGNLIDLGIMAPMAVDDVVAGVLRKGLARDSLMELRRDLAAANSLLYVGDNAGEIAFDRLLIEEIRREYPALGVTFVVKSGPAMNDATLSDADAVGMSAVAEVIESGGAYLGVPLNESSPAFWERYRRAGVVIAKGHANYETLDEAPRPALYFLVTVKCGIVANTTGARIGDSILIQPSLAP